MSRCIIESDEVLIDQKHRIEERIGQPWNIKHRFRQFNLYFVLLKDELTPLELPVDFRHFMLAVDDTYKVSIELAFAQLRLHKLQLLDFSEKNSMQRLIQQFFFGNVEMLGEET